MTHTPAGEVDRLCARYDGLLADPPQAPSAEDLRDLRALAAVFDLDDAERSGDGGALGAAELWRSLRAFLTRQPSAAAGQDAAPPAGLTVLVTEDDPDAAASLVEGLTEAGHGVVGPFASAESALAAAAVHAVDVALVDINLAGEKTGLDLARALTADWGVPSVFVSGNVRLTAANAELAAAVVMKPYRTRDVLAALNAAVSAEAA